MKTLSTIYLMALTVFLFSCSETKTIYKDNKVYQYKNNQGTDKKDQVIEYTVKKPFKSEVKDKTDYFELSVKDPALLSKSNEADIPGDEVGKFTGMDGKYYAPQAISFKGSNVFDNGSFKYYYPKFALTAMTIPLKFRPGIGNDTLTPPTLETGFNVNFAPSLRFNFSSFDPNRKFLGSNITNYSLTVGGLFGIGGTDLNNATNAKGLLSNRKSATVSFGGTVMLGLNTFGIGYSIGLDHVLGKGSDYWVYQGKVWHGVAVSVDLIK